MLEPVFLLKCWGNVIMVKKLLLLISVLSFVTCCNVVFAAKKVVYGNSEYIITGTMNQSTVEQLAMETARKVAAESTGSLIIGQTVVEKNVLLKDDIKVLLRAMAELVPGSEHKHYEVVNQTDNTRKLFYSASFIIDEEEFEKQVQALERKEKTTMQAIQKASGEYEKLVKTEQQYQKDYETFLKRLGEKDSQLVSKNMKELDIYAREQRYKDLAYEHYKNYNFLLAERCFLEAAKACESMKEFYGAERNSVLNASLAYYQAGMSASVFDAERAMEDAKKAHEINPYSELPLELMGICAWKQHKFEDAVNYFKQSLDIKPQTSVHIKLATLYLSLGELQKFEKEANRLWQSNLEVLSSPKELKSYENIYFLKENVNAFKNKNNWDFGKYIFLRSGYDTIGKHDFPFDEFCAYQNGSNKSYLFRYYYFPGNQFGMCAIHIIPYDHTKPDEKDIWIYGKL